MGPATAFERLHPFDFGSVAKSLYPWGYSMSIFESQVYSSFRRSPQVAPFGTDTDLCRFAADEGSLFTKVPLEPSALAVSIHRIDELDRCLIVVPFIGTSDHFVHFRFTGKLTFSLYQ
jgi:hypothetical protein